MSCKNCGATGSDKFCSHCGQKSSVSKITGASLLSELSESVFQMDRGLLFTFKELSTRPGDSLREYLSGKRKNHFKPIAYLLFFSTVYFLVTKLSLNDTWVNEMISGFSEGAMDAAHKTELPSIIHWFASNYAYATLLLIPIFSIASYLSFLKYETNYLEHIVLNCFITGHQAIIYLLLASVNIVLKFEWLETLPVFVAMCYNIWVFSSFFKQGTQITNICRTLLTYLLFSALSIGALLLLIALQGIA